MSDDVVPPTDPGDASSGETGVVRVSGPVHSWLDEITTHLQQDLVLTSPVGPRSEPVGAAGGDAQTDARWEAHQRRMKAQADARMARQQLHAVRMSSQREARIARKQAQLSEAMARAMQELDVQEEVALLAIRNNAMRCESQVRERFAISRRNTSASIMAGGTVPVGVPPCDTQLGSSHGSITETDDVFVHEPSLMWNGAMDGDSAEPSTVGGWVFVGVEFVFVVVMFCYGVHVVRRLGPRGSQLLSSHGEITEGDDLSAHMYASDRGAVNSGSRHGGRERTIGRGSQRRGAIVQQPLDLAMVSVGESINAELQSPVAVGDCVMHSDPDGGSTSSVGGGSGQGVSEYMVYRLGERFASFRNVLTRFQLFGERYQWITEDGEIVHHVVEEGTFLKEYLADPLGTMKYHPGSPGRVAQFPYQLCVGGDEGGLEWAYIPALQRLRSKFACCDMTVESTIRAALNRLLTDYPGQPVAIIQSTVHQYVMENKSLNTLPKAVPVADHFSRLVPPEEFERIVLATSLLDSHNHRNVGLGPRDYVECSLRPDPDKNHRRDVFRVIAPKAGSLSTGRGAVLADGRLTYATADDRPVSRYLVACDLVGANGSRFERARATAGNQNAALIRLYKCRGGSRASDDEYAGLQLGFVEAITGFADRELSSVCNFIASTGDGFEFLRRGWRKVFPSPQPSTHHHSVPAFNRILDVYRPGGGSAFWHLKVLFTKAYGNVLRIGAQCVYSTTLVGLLLYDVITFRYYFGHFPHDKRNLRMRVGKMLIGANVLGDDVFCPEVKAEVKDEFVKVGKPPRLFFSLGVEAPMYGGAWLALAKEDMKGERVIHMKTYVLYLRFCDTNKPLDMSERFAELYDRVHSSERSVTIDFFSDDMVVVGNLCGRMFWEVDISMCDGSNGFGTFYIAAQRLLDLGVPREIVHGLLQQCMRPFRITNPANRSEYLLCQFLTCYLVSGTVLTTFVDNWASLMIVSAIAAAFDEGVFCPERILDWVREVGYIVTIEVRAEFEQLTMLKRHPCRATDGTWCAPLCLGAHLRGFGKIMCQLDQSVVPNSTGQHIDVRARRFLCGVTSSWVNEPSDPVRDALRLAFPPAQDVNLPIEFRKHYDPTATRDRRSLDVSSLCQRYNLDPMELLTFAETLQKTTIGSIVESRVLAEIYKVDYGL